MLSRFSVILFYLLTIKFTILLFFSLSSALLSLNFGLFDIFVPERDLYQSYYWWPEVKSDLMIRITAKAMSRTAAITPMTMPAMAPSDRRPSAENTVSYGGMLHVKILLLMS